MPSKIQLDENLWFLFICLQKSDYKTIDFNAVGKATNLKPPAARMRFTRLRRQIGGGTSVETHNTPYPGAFDKPANSGGKRKTSEGRPMASKRPVIVSKMRIKTECEQSSDEYETDSSGYDDSEDEMPLAKRKQDRLFTKSSGFSTTSSATRAGNTKDRMQENDIRLARFQPSIRPEQTMIDHKNIASLERQLEVNLAPQLCMHPFKTISTQTSERTPCYALEHQGLYTQLQARPLYLRPRLSSTGMNNIEMKSVTDSKVHHRKDSANVKLEDVRIR